MNHFLKFYWLLDGGILTWGLLKLCVLLILFQLGCKLLMKRLGLVLPFFLMGGIIGPGLFFSLSADIVEARVRISQKLYSDLQIGEMDNEPTPSLKEKSRIALEGFQGLIRDGIHRHDVFIPYGLLLLQTGKASDTADFLDQELTRFPDDGELRVLYGRALFLAGRLEKAVLEAEKSLPMISNELYVLWAYRTMMEGNLCLGKPEKADEIFQKQMKSLEGNQEAQTTLKEYFDALKKRFPGAAPKP